MTDQTVLITGASSGIGHALALKYLNAGARVYVCGRNQAKLENCFEGYQQAIPLVFDINDTAQLNHAAAELPALDSVVLNAGDCEYIDDAQQFDGELFERVVRTNLIATGHCLAALLPLLKPGSNLALVSSSVVYVPLSRAEAYGASKAGMTYLAKSLAVDLAVKGIHVAVVHPGFVKTPLTDKNTFEMPFLITSEQAAERIYSGLKANKHEIHFPKRFTFLLRLFSSMPFGMWKKCAQRFS